MARKKLCEFTNRELDAIESGLELIEDQWPYGSRTSTRKEIKALLPKVREYRKSKSR